MSATVEIRHAESSLKVFEELLGFLLLLTTELLVDLARVDQQRHGRFGEQFLKVLRNSELRRVRDGSDGNGILDSKVNDVSS